MSKSDASKRISRELKELVKNPSKSWLAQPADDNLFEWHFTVRGPTGSDFEGGLYHGRIVLPVNYPFAPPSIMLLNPNGRFEVGKKICLSMSNFHPELWQPAWGIRTMLEALRSFFPTPGDGAIGSLDWPSDVRKKLAKESVDWVAERCDGMKLSEILPPLAPGEREDEPDLPPEARPEAEAIAAAKAIPPSTDPASVPVPDEAIPDAPAAEARAPSPVRAAPAPAPAPAQSATGPSPIPAAAAPSPVVPAPAPVPAAAAAAAPAKPPQSPKASRRDPKTRVAPKQVPILLQLIKVPRTGVEIGITLMDMLAFFLFGAICVLLADIAMNPPHRSLMSSRP